jgi:hypothetical protein
MDVDRVDRGALVAEAAALADVLARVDSRCPAPALAPRRELGDADELAGDFDELALSPTPMRVFDDLAGATGEAAASGSGARGAAAG